MLMSGLGMTETSRLGDQRQELGDVVIVHGMHGGEVRAGDAALQAEASGLEGELLDVAGMRVVGLVAMQIDGQAARGGDLAELGDGSPALGHGALEMRDAADHIDAEVERAKVFARALASR